MKVPIAKGVSVWTTSCSPGSHAVYQKEMYLQVVLPGGHLDGLCDTYGLGFFMVQPWVWETAAEICWNLVLSCVHLCSHWCYCIWGHYRRSSLGIQNPWRSFCRLLLLFGVDAQSDLVLESRLHLVSNNWSHVDTAIELWGLLHLGWFLELI